MGAKYLIRFDDICPTMNWRIWEQVEEVLMSAGIKPVLAVVPDNLHPKLKLAEPNPRFWDRVRDWQGRGWTIGLHGYQHLAATSDGGILRINEWGEFSGLESDVQQTKLLQALAIFKSQGVRPELWVAPGHSFDAITLQALDGVGIRRLSDGFSLFPYRDSAGMLWVPQQLGRLRKMPFGLWTVCIHANNWTSEDVNRFHADLRDFGALVTDWNSIVSLYQHRKRSVMDWLFSQIHPLVLRTRRWLTVRSHDQPRDGHFGFGVGGSGSA